ncbi:unnamed protein product [Orchesella dallaii]|uniref:Uncharacterized protein n=1 Tax=Orchesella dallaii TaxID=48710 RepID=A0ABP1RIT7_9HEXA
MAHKMVLLQLAFLLVVVAAGVNSKLLEKLLKPPQLKINGTETVDKILANIQKTIKVLKLDPIKTLPLELPGLSLRNGTINGLSNIQRVGDVVVTVDLTSAKLSSAFSIKNLSSDEDVTVNGKKGHVHTDCEHVTASTVYKFDGVTQTLSLKTFNLSIGTYEFKVTGFGNAGKATGDKINSMFAVVKGPMLTVFSNSLKTAINIALATTSAITMG